MPKQRNKAHHLDQVATAAATIEKALRVQYVATVQARRAGASWAEIAAANPVRPPGLPWRIRSRQNAQQLFGGWTYDEATDELSYEPSMF